VRLTREWLEVVGCDSGPVWRSTSKKDKILETGISRTTFIKGLKFRAAQAELDVRIGGHSFRRGGASELAEAGVPRRWLEVAGRWKQGSRSVDEYIDTRSGVYDAIAANLWGTSIHAAAA
jgi:integrase